MNLIIRKALFTSLLLIPLLSCSLFDDDDDDPSPSAKAGAIAGIVSDTANGALLGGVVIDVSSHTTTTANDGSYQLTGIAPGSYTLLANKSGYLDYSGQVSITENATSSFDFQMQVDPIPQNGLIAYYPFNGDAQDLSGNGNNGTVSGPTLVADRKGHPASAYHFDGINDFISVADSPSLNPISAISISAWYKYETFRGDGNNAIVDKGFTSHVTPHYQFHLGFSDESFINAAGTFAPGWIAFSIASNNSVVPVYAGDNTLNYTDWMHIVVTYDGTEMNLYVDNQVANSVAASGNIDNYGRELVIGSFSNRGTMPVVAGKSHYTKGSIDDIRLYNRALTASEVDALFNE